MATPGPVLTWQKAAEWTPAAAFKGAIGSRAAAVPTAPCHLAAAASQRQTHSSQSLCCGCPCSGETFLCASAFPTTCPFTHRLACILWAAAPATPHLTDSAPKMAISSGSTQPCPSGRPRAGVRETEHRALSRGTASLPPAGQTSRAGVRRPQETTRSLKRPASARRPASPRAGLSPGGVKSAGTGQPLLREPTAAEGPLREVAQRAWAGKPRFEGRGKIHKLNCRSPQTQITVRAGKRD